MVLAGVAFVLVEYYFWFVLPKYRHHGPGPLGLDIYFNLSWGILVALYFLLVGYVSKDAPRRGMSTRFWMLVCVVLPGGIGAVPDAVVAVTAGSERPVVWKFAPVVNENVDVPAMAFPATS